MYPESKKQHGYFAYIRFGFFLTFPIVFLPVFFCYYLSAFPRTHLIVHKVRISALTQTTSPYSPVCLAGVLPWQGYSPVVIKLPLSPAD